MYVRTVCAVFFEMEEVWQRVGFLFFISSISNIYKLEHRGHTLVDYLSIYRREVEKKTCEGLNPLSSQSGQGNL